MACNTHHVRCWQVLFTERKNRNTNNNDTALNSFRLITLSCDCTIFPPRNQTPINWKNRHPPHIICFYYRVISTILSCDFTILISCDFYNIIVRFYNIIVWFYNIILWFSILSCDIGLSTTHLPLKPEGGLVELPDEVGVDALKDVSRPDRRSGKRVAGRFVQTT